MYFQKWIQRMSNQSKVNEAKTVQNIKCEPILGWSSDFIYRTRKLEFEKRAKIPHRGQNLLF